MKFNTVSKVRKLVEVNRALKTQVTLLATQVALGALCKEKTETEKAVEDAIFIASEHATRQRLMPLFE